MGDIVITGMGAVTPLGNGVYEYFERWRQGDCAISEGTAYCHGFRAEEQLGRKQVRRMDRFTQLAMVAADEAATQAGWDDGLPCDPYRIACVVGTSMGGATTLEEGLLAAHERGARAAPALGIAMVMGNAAAAMTSIRYGLKGECIAVNGACATGGAAIVHAYRLIESGYADAALVGGSEGPASSISLEAIKRIGVVSMSGVCRPFDRRRDGFVHGEGAGLLTLEQRELAEARGAQILGEVLSCSSNADAFHMSAPEPSGETIARAMTDAIEGAQVSATDIRYVNAHGTGTIANDRAETAALKAALGAHAYGTPISSVKSAIGHTVGAAGALEMIATVVALQEGVAPPTVNLEEPEEGLDLNFVADKAQAIDRLPGEPLVGMSNSFGLGGHNTVVVVRAEPAGPHTS